MTLIRIPD